MKLQHEHLFCCFLVNQNPHVEDRDGREGARVPLLLVVGQGGVERIGEFANDGDRPLVTRQMGLFTAVDDLLEDQERDDSREDRRRRGLSTVAAISATNDHGPLS